MIVVYSPPTESSALCGTTTTARTHEMFHTCACEMRARATCIRVCHSGAEHAAVSLYLTLEHLDDIIKVRILVLERVAVGGPQIRQAAVDVKMPHGVARMSVHEEGELAHALLEKLWGQVQVAAL